MPSGRKVAFVTLFVGIVLLVMGQAGSFTFPMPFPIPGPFPGPVVKKDIAWVVIVEESTERKPIVSQILTSGWLQQAQSKGFKAIIADKDLPHGKPYMGVIGSRPLPVAVVMDGENKVLGIVDLPGDVSQLDAAIQEVGRYAN
jgi:hypothetical protein